LWLSFLGEAISYVVHCDTQEEIDYYWERLSADPNGGQCGWLKDKYGLSWQITPTIMDQMLGSGDPQGLARVTQAFLKMKKFNISELQRAFDGK
jgi:predicted 3-demethylubiquinone-9 3-methyltransferase (glyoxalase superfamily)